MNLDLKANAQKLFKKHGAIFAGVYVFGFIVLVTLRPKFGFPALPGDIVIGESIYIPIVGALAIAVFITIIFEVYKNLKQ